jgi:DNA-binding NarL/FixJ family response regulator
MCTDASSYASSLWPELLAGEVTIVDCGVTPTSHYFHIARGARGRGLDRLSQRRIERLERVLLGQSQKVVASETRCSISTVASDVGGCLRALGLQRKCSNVPALLVLMLHVLHGKAGRLEVRLQSQQREGGELQVLESPRPELALSDRLSEGELEVTSALVEGKSYRDIARQRRTSPRTVANQIGNVYRKLGVSGRLGLLCYLASAS